MIQRFLLLCLLCSAVCANAVDRITATITITNAPTTNGMTITVNGAARVWTNSVLDANTTILTNATTSGSASNLFGNLSANPPAGFVPYQSASNVIVLGGASGATLTLAFSAGYAYATFATQAVSQAWGVRVPLAVESDAQKTNIASGLVDWLNQNGATNALHENAPAVQNLVGLTNAQTIAGVKAFTNSAGEWYGVVSNSPAISGTVGGLTNGTLWAFKLSAPYTTNLVNQGSAISSPGTGESSQQLGGSTAIGEFTTGLGYDSGPQAGYATAIGAFSIASATNATSLGYLAQAVHTNSTAVGELSYAGGEESSAFGAGSSVSDGAYRGLAIGAGALASSMNSGAFGTSASSTATNSLALGISANAYHNNSVALGYLATSTAADQVRLGTATHTVSIPGLVSVDKAATFGSSVTVSGGASIAGAVTNLTTSGQANVPSGSDIAFGLATVSSLVNSNNASVPVGQNTIVKLSGPTAAFNVCGLNAGTAQRDGKLLVLVNRTGYDMYLEHQSGVEPAGSATNRIISLTGATRNTTGDGAATLIYSASESRWLLIAIDP